MLPYTRAAEIEKYHNNVNALYITFADMRLQRFGYQVEPACPSGRANSSLQVLMLQRNPRVKLTHDTKLEGGSVVSLSFIFTIPP